MGNKFVSPLPSFESTCQQLNKEEINQLKINFNKLSLKQEKISLQNLSRVVSCPDYFRKQFLARLFNVIDTKKDNFFDLEEFMVIETLFKGGTDDELITVLFLMYEPNKSGYLQRSSLFLFVQDAIALSMSLTLSRSKSASVVTDVSKHWMDDQKDITNGLVEIILCQYGALEGKLYLEEFIKCCKEKEEGRNLVTLLKTILVTN